MGVAKHHTRAGKVQLPVRVGVAQQLVGVAEHHTHVVKVQLPVRVGVA